MAIIYTWSTTPDGTYAFDPEADQLVIDEGISAASILFNRDAAEAAFTFGGKTITLQVSPYALTGTNVVFGDGSVLVVGDNTTTVPDSMTGGADHNPSTITGGTGHDQLVGGDGADLFAGLAGNDNIHGYGGDDTLDYSTSPSSIIANLDILNAVTVGSTTVQPNSVLDGYGTTDTINTLSNVIGSAFNDYIVAGVGASVLEGGAGNDTLAGGPSTGDAVNDTLLGGDGADELRLGGGADSLDGGAGPGNDRLTFVGNGVIYGGATGVNVNLGAGTADYNTANGANPLATIVNIERVFGTVGNDILTGGGLTRGGSGTFLEQFRGGAGNDTINGGGIGPSGNFRNGSDRAEYVSSTSEVNVNLATGVAHDGLGGTDTLININWVQGSHFNDTLTGGNANFPGLERFEGMGGNDTINGGAGFDQTSYQDSPGAVNVNLATGIALDGHGGTDTLISIEGVRGSDFGDTITGSGAATVEIFIGEGGDDTINGGGGIDFASWQNTALVDGGVNALLANGSGTGTHATAGTDTLSNIEGLAGTNSNDTLAGGAGNQLFRGRGGSDIINGGAGIDTADYSNDPGAVIVNLGTNGIVVGSETVAGGTARDGWGGLWELGGTDTLTAIENVTGSDFNDYIMGSTGANLLDGGKGNDSLVGGSTTSDSANDTLRGGDGDDVLFQTRGADSIDGGTGSDQLQFGFTGITYSGATGVSVNLGAGTSDYNRADGANPVATVANIDFVFGTAGNDSIVGGSAARAGSGTFVEQYIGGAGNDTIDGAGAGLEGSRGFTDRVLYTSATAAVNVNLSTGTATGGGGTDTLIGIDWVQASNFNDTLTGGNPAGTVERFEGMGGNDTINGGAGADEAVYQNASGAVIVNLATGTATGAAGTDMLIGIERVRGSNFGDTLIGSNSASVTEFFTGHGGNDTINGGAGIDFASWQNLSLSAGGLNALVANGSGTVTHASAGTDTLVNIEGLAGTNSNDTLAGGAGDQLFRGRGGSDIINGGAGVDTVDYSSDPNAVIVNLGATSITVGSTIVAAGTARDGWGGIFNMQGVDNLTGIENVTGSALNDTIVGNALANVIDGGAGNDSMSGGAGNDTYFVYAATDLVTEAAASGIDTIQSSVTIAVLAANVENLTLIDTDHINGTGNGLNNRITGNSANNILNGAAGNDTINGGGGNDTLNGSTGNDSMAGGAGNDTYVRNAAGDVVTELAAQGNDLVQSAVTYALGANLERLTLTGAGNLNGTGNGLANIVTGNAGNNLLNGAGGADTLNGLGGNDTLIWDAADTKADGGVGSDTLRINGANQTLNLAGLSGTKIVNVEVINITGTGNNRLELLLQDVLDLSTTTNTLRVDGNVGDVVDRNGGWVQGANQLIGANSYFRYTQGAATLLVDTDITVTT